MKILYSTDNRPSAAYQLSQFCKYTSHQVKIAASSFSGRLLDNFSWNLGSRNFEQLQKDIIKYNPDFAVIDAEPIVANICKQLSIPIIYCSSFHLMNGLFLERKKTYKYSFVLDKIFWKLNLPPGVITFVYSPLGNLDLPLILKENYQWVEPYFDTSINHLMIDDPLRKKKISKFLNYIDDIVFCSGETQHLSNLIFNDTKFCLTPTLSDPENVINALFCDKFGIAPNLNQVELLENLAIEEIKNKLNTFEYKKYNKISRKKLHERIDELWEI